MVLIGSPDLEYLESAHKTIMGESSEEFEDSDLPGMRIADDEGLKLAVLISSSQAFSGWTN